MLLQFYKCHIISLHGFELSNQKDCNHLVGPIELHVIFWILADNYFVIIDLAGRIALQFSQRFLVLQLGGFIFLSM